MRLRAAAALRGLGLEDAKRYELTLCVEQALDRRSAQRADQLVLQIGVTGEEAERFEAIVGVTDNHPGAPQRLAQLPLLGRVVQSSQAQPYPLRSEYHSKMGDFRHAAGWHDDDVLRIEVIATPLGQRLQRALIAPTLDQNRRASGNRKRVFANNVRHGE